MTQPFGRNQVSVLAQPDFRNVASRAFDAGHTLPQLLIECRTALDELTQILKLGSVYPFQLA